MEAAINLPVGTILAKFIEPTTPGTQLNIREDGAGITLRMELGYRCLGICTMDNSTSSPL